jgi:hypothetical protein
MADEFTEEEKRKQAQVNLIVSSFKGGSQVSEAKAWEFVESEFAPADYPSGGFTEFDILTKFAEFLDQEQSGEVF